MEVIIIKPIGFCYGVKRALDLIQSEDNKSRLVISNIINNKYVTNLLINKGFVFCYDNFDDNKEYICNAHGYTRNLKICLDTTCPKVSLIKKQISECKTKIIYLGNESHNEVKAMLEVREDIIIFNDLAKLNLLDKNEDYTLFNQTTLDSNIYNDNVIEIQKVFPKIKIINCLCSEVIERSNTLLNYDYEDNSILFIIGDILSNNSKTLLSISSKKIKSYLISDVTDIKNEYLIDISKVYLASATSTSLDNVNDIYNFLINIK